MERNTGTIYLQCQPRYHTCARLPTRGAALAASLHGMWRLIPRRGVLACVCKEVAVDFLPLVVVVGAAAGVVTSAGATCAGATRHRHPAAHPPAHTLLIQLRRFVVRPVMWPTPLCSAGLCLMRRSVGSRAGAAAMPAMPAPPASRSTTVVSPGPPMASVTPAVAVAVAV